MTRPATLPRRHPVRSGLVASILALAAAATAASPALAQSTPRFDIRIEQDTRPRTSVLSNLSVAYRVTVTDRATGQPPERHVVFAQATNQQGEKTPFYACGHTNDVDSRTPPGVFDCTVIVDHGGAWTFVAAVSEERTNREQSRAPVAQASVPFELTTPEVTTGEVPGSEVSASGGDVAILFGHASAAAAWFACVALLTLLALPGARRYLSEIGRHRLERHLDLIVKGTWVTTGLVAGSGVYLTFTQTAYDAPFSSAAIDAVFALPYGRPYFLALAAKIALYALLAAAGVPLVSEARRRLLVSADPAAAGPPEVDGPPHDDGPLEVIPPRRRDGGQPSGGRTALAVADPEVAAAVGRSEARPVERPAPVTVRVAPLVVLAGGVGIAVCVTILKYLHELIESARGLL
jgi:hypothetical protein